MKEIYFSSAYRSNCDMKDATQKINQMLLVGTLYETRVYMSKNFDEWKNILAHAKWAEKNERKINFWTTWCIAVD